MTNKRAPELDNVSDASVTYLLTEYKKYEDQLAAMRKKFKLWRKQNIQGVGIKQKVFDRVYEKFHAEDGGDEAIADLRVERELCKKANIDFGFQFSFFDEDPPDEAQRKTGAYAKGQMAFIARVKESENPFDPSSEQGQGWLKGFRDSESLHKKGKEEVQKTVKSSATKDKPATKKKAAKKKATKTA